MDNKIKVAIDIDEILRSKARQFHRYYVEEFGEEGVPSNPFTLDFFNEYKWDHKIEKTKVLRQDNEIDLETIEPNAYILDENNEAPVDSIIFDTETKELTPEMVYNNFMNNDFASEIYGFAPKIYRDIDVDMAKFMKKYLNFIDITIISKENYYTIPATLFFLSKAMSRVNNYHFFSKYENVGDMYDLVITTDPKLINAIEKNKVIKVSRPYNNTIIGCAMESLNVVDLIENKEFEKLINYTNE